MAKREADQYKRFVGYVWNHTLRGSWWRKTLTYLAIFILIITACLYGIAEWYVHKHSSEPLELGTTFIPDYAKQFGLNPDDTLKAILGDLNMKHIRLVSYWEDIEPTQGHYDFSELDHEFALANQYHAKVSLALGLRQPRWPECHEPQWTANEPKNQWQPQLYKFMTAVVNRYKNNPALESYQVENEYFMKVFGHCLDFDRERLVEEYNLVKDLDPNHTVIVSRSNNWVGIPVRGPVPDEFGISVYKRVWDTTVTGRYFEYPLPPWFYAALAGSEEIWSGRNMIIHELQAEPWPPHGQAIVDTPVKEQYKSMDAARLKARIKYGEDTGMREIYLWGAPWWYYMKVKQHDPSEWNVVKQAVIQANAENAKLAAQQHKKISVIPQQTLSSLSLPKA